jgi:signal transduction histidine kinase
MATDLPAPLAAMLADLDAPAWTRVLAGVEAAAAWLGEAVPGDPAMREVIDRLVSLAGHPKWEVRRAVAAAAARTRHGEFEPALVRLATDHNEPVRRAAAAALLRRRDWTSAGVFSRQHEDHITARLDDIEARLGPRARAAVRRAAEDIAGAFSRELYHEMIQLLSPLGTSADRLLARLNDDAASRADLAKEAARMQQRVARLHAVLKGMRRYTAQPALAFAMAPMRDILDESVALVRDQHRPTPPPIVLRADPDLGAEVCRDRLVQAVTNLLANAIEAYDDVEHAAAIEVTASGAEDRIELAITDHGCGMTEDALADARVLFVTSKPEGTGFGLPLAVKIIEAEHDGRLYLESRVGHGTTARIVLPVRHTKDRG